MKFSKIFASIIAVGSVTFASVGFAQVYVSGAVGASKLAGACDGLTSCSESGTGFKLAAGYKINPNVAVEFIYADYGKAGISDSSGTYDVNETSVGIGALLSADVAPNFVAFTRIGVASNKADQSITIYGVGSASANETKTKPYFGFGLGYSLNKQVSIEGSFDFTPFEYGGATDKARMFSLGLRYNF